MSLKHSYRFIAPFYDATLEAATRAIRRESLTALPSQPSRVLINGIGTGLDLPHLPTQHQYTGIDLSPAMLGRALGRKERLPFLPVQGDVQRLPFAAGSFDAAVLHLILAVVPDPAACLAETARVLRPGGSILIIDKFLRPGQQAPLRRLLNPLARRIATRLDVVWEDVLATTPNLVVLEDCPILAGGWFRRIRLVKR
ncbi:MAG: phosphatidyl-N-methylethanolamine N-methyltransferase [Rhodocyclaceae bacterium]|nr:phosphatidyl-N-methylethanolamine N-methyltransferase [Rhodocyclaceae bacterium]